MSPAVASGTRPSGFAWAGCDQQVFFVAAGDSAVHALAYDSSESTCRGDIVP